jgi:hypothetical protein
VNRFNDLFETKYKYNLNLYKKLSIIIHLLLFRGFFIMDCPIQRNNLPVHLYYREMGYSPDEETSLTTFFRQTVENNNLNENFFSYQVNLCEPPVSLSLSARNHQFVAFAGTDKVGLYDLVAREKTWECRYGLHEGFRLKKLHVTCEGLVVLSSCDDSGTGREKNIYQIFSGGEETGIININSSDLFVYDETLKVENERLYVLVKVVDKLAIYIFDHKGSKVKEITFNELTRKFFLGFETTFFNDNYCVLGFGHVKWGTEEIQSGVFVQNMKFGTQQIYHLMPPGKKFFPQCAFIYGDTLFCSIRYNLDDSDVSEDEPFEDTKIVVVNLRTQEVEKEYKVENMRRNITSLVANDDYIVWTTAEARSRYRDAFLMYIPRHTGRKNMYTLSLLPVTPLAGYLNLNLSGHLLSVCFRESSEDTYYIIDLPKYEVVGKQVTFKNVNLQDNFRELSYQDGILVNFDKERSCMYVEDYVQVNGDPEKNLIEPRKWKRKMNKM